MKDDTILKIYTDGAARGNPGPAASAFLIVIEKQIIHQNVDYIGSATNNTAEYKAIISALQSAQKYNKDIIEIYTDSKLAVNQITDKWKINYPHLLNLVKEIRRLMAKFRKVNIFHVKRTHPYIQKCDQLCNERLDAEPKS
ncbi:MAG: ribonuclease HI family protein [Promethearchaeota archaeon]|nr:MAG: ribonuclease HI family protein [Candidatus Lokiarchaeota archaeon]